VMNKARGATNELKKSIKRRGNSLESRRTSEGGRSLISKDDGGSLGKERLRRGGLIAKKKVTVSDLQPEKVPENWIYRR